MGSMLIREHVVGCGTASYEVSTVAVTSVVVTWLITSTTEYHLVDQWYPFARFLFGVPAD